MVIDIDSEIAAFSSDWLFVGININFIVGTFSTIKYGVTLIPIQGNKWIWKDIEEYFCNHSQCKKW